MADLKNPTSEDNNLPLVGVPRVEDAHGRAAMLLVESLIHVLIAKGVINVEDAIETVDVAADVTREMADGHAPADTVQKLLVLITSIGTSLSHDLKEN